MYDGHLGWFFANCELLRGLREDRIGYVVFVLWRMVLDCFGCYSGLIVCVVVENRG